ncbi:hypothetical protein [Methylorubrum salsuginis]|nr:hypothetical protein [Methylorubrum salsuginis]
MAFEAKRVSKPMTRLGSFLVCLGVLADIWPASSEPLRYPHHDEAEALFGDGLRSGDDMRIVIERAQATVK